MKIFVKYLPGAEELYYKTEGSACADLRYFDFDGSKPELAIMPGETVMIHTLFSPALALAAKVLSLPTLSALLTATIRARSCLL